jgi:hypothetical protein
MKSLKCRFCNCDIIFITDKYGKRVPCETQPVKVFISGMTYMRMDGTRIHAGHNLNGEELFVPHKQICKGRL